MNAENNNYLGYIPKVYMGFTAMLGLATLGIVLTLAFELSHSFSVGCGLSSLGVLLYGLYSVRNGNIRTMEICAYLVSLLLGINIVPLLNVANYIDPNIVLYAFTGTTVIFVTTTGYVLLWDPFKHNVNGLYFLGQTLATWLSISIFSSLANIYFQSELMYTFEIYLSLLAFTLFVAYDTGTMIEKCRRGSQHPDYYIMDSLNLFLDFANIFIKLIQILAKLKSKDNKKRK